MNAKQHWNLRTNTARRSHSYSWLDTRLVTICSNSESRVHNECSYSSLPCFTAVHCPNQPSFIYIQNDLLLSSWQLITHLFMLWLNNPALNVDNYLSGNQGFHHSCSHPPSQVADVFTFESSNFQQLHLLRLCDVVATLCCFRAKVTCRNWGKHEFHSACENPEEIIRLSVWGAAQHTWILQQDDAWEEVVLWTDQEQEQHSCGWFDCSLKFRGQVLIDAGVILLNTDKY